MRDARDPLIAAGHSALVDRIDAVLEAIPDPSVDLPADAHKLAQVFVQAKRRAKACDTEAKKMKALAERIIEPLRAAMLEGRYPTSANVDGANVHRKAEVFVSPPAVEIDGEKVRDHARLTAIIESYIADHPEDPTNWSTLLPSTINTNSLRGTVNGYLREYDFTVEEKMLPVRDRLKIAGFPEPILEVLDIQEGYTVNANGL